MNYGQQTSWLLGCLDAGRTFDLDVAGCRLASHAAEGPGPLTR